MHIAILTVGSRGDVQPYVALGRGLQAAGHQVVLATHGEFEGFVRANGIEFAQIPGNPFGGLNVVGDGATPQEQAAQRPFIAQFEESLVNWLRGGLAAARHADVLIFSQLCFAGYFVAEKLGLACLMANHTPATPTSAFPTVYGQGPRWLGPIYNRLSHLIDQQLFWQPIRTVVNRLRQDVLDLPPLPLLGYYARIHREQVPILYGYSRHVFGTPPDWPPWVHVTGYWLLPAAADWQPDPALEAFVAAGAPPVFLGLGSVANSNPYRVMHTLLAALARLGLRTVVMPGRVDLEGIDLPAETLMTGPTAYDWLFPRMAGVISHGGPGTLAYAFQAGVPAMGIPFFGDQPFWSRRCAELGVGPQPIPAGQVTIERATVALDRLARDPALRAQAAALGAQIQAEDGIGTAVMIIERHVAAGQQRAAAHSVASSVPK